MSNLSFVRYVGDGRTTQFALAVAGVNIGYFRTTDIHGYIDGKEVAININSSTPHMVNINPAPSTGADILLRREMPEEKPYANFERGNNFGHRQVNNTFVQQLYLTQELLDGFFPSGFYFKQDIGLGGYKITNLGDAIGDSDAVNKKVTDSLNKRLESLEHSVTGESRFLPWSYNAVGGEDTLEPPYQFEGSRVFINGIRQRQGESYEIVGLTIMLAEPLEEGDWVDVELGTEPADVVPQDISSYSVTSLGTSIKRALVYRFSETVNPLDFGAKGDGIADDTLPIKKALDYMKDGDVLDLRFKHYSVLHNITPTQGLVDCVSTDEMLYVYGKRDLVIKDGTIFAHNPKVSPKKVNFPSTLAFDGCHGVKLLNVNLLSKGESYGDSDASSVLGREERRKFLAQNGGHAFVATRCSGFEIDNCSFRLCGSVGSYYTASCDGFRVNNCFSNCGSLGYALYAVDSWCGSKEVSGFSEHFTEFSNCSGNKESYTYAGKGGLVTEDRDVVVVWNGGVIEDCYANGSAVDLGGAWSSNTCTVYVNNAVARNCDAVATTGHSADATCKLVLSGCQAYGLRTSVLKQWKNSFGKTDVSMDNCHFEFGNYSAPATVQGKVKEYEQRTIVANRKVSSQILVELNNCVVKGADIISYNTVGCYGGLRIVGGHYDVYDYCIKSAGWGGGNKGTERGFEILGSKLKFTSFTKTDALNDITNKWSGKSGTITTYFYMDISEDTKVFSQNFRRWDGFSVQSASTLSELHRDAAELTNCYSMSKDLNSEQSQLITIKELQGLTGSDFCRVKLRYVNNRICLSPSYFMADTSASSLSFDMLQLYATNGLPFTEGNELVQNVYLFFGKGKASSIGSRITKDHTYSLFGAAYGTQAATLSHNEVVVLDYTATL